jgi:hypothetical protein
MWLEDEEKEGIVGRFGRRVGQFIRTVERVEGRGAEGACSRSHNRFNLAARCSFDVDEVYWEFFHEMCRGEDMLDEAEIGEKEKFLKHKIGEFEEYLRQRGLGG